MIERLFVTVLMLAGPAIRADAQVTTAVDPTPTPTGFVVPDYTGCRVEIAEGHLRAITADGVQLVIAETEASPTSDWMPPGDAERQAFIVGHAQGSEPGTQVEDGEVVGVIIITTDPTPYSTGDLILTAVVAFVAGVGLCLLLRPKR